MEVVSWDNGLCRSEVDQIGSGSYQMVGDFETLDSATIVTDTYSDGRVE
jgi:hypothetical protein